MLSTACKVLIASLIVSFMISQMACNSNCPCENRDCDKYCFKQGYDNCHPFFPWQFSLKLKRCDDCFTSCLNKTQTICLEKTKELCQ
uniref:Egg protein CP422 n=1 Tax=Schistosoma japonicum TaxID=6182 RepID=Q4JL34_SCHJA|nr:unknown [Schistosoma japonicum]